MNIPLFAMILAVSLIANATARADDDATSRFHDLYNREWAWREAQTDVTAEHMHSC